MVRLRRIEDSSGEGILFVSEQEKSRRFRMLLDQAQHLLCGLHLTKEAQFLLNQTGGYLGGGFEPAFVRLPPDVTSFR